MWNNFVGAHFVTLCGVRQVGVLYLLFSVYVDDAEYSCYGSQSVGTILYDFITTCFHNHNFIVYITVTAAVLLNNDTH